MIIFSKSLIRDAAIWFKSLRADSIGSWIELTDAFLKHWGENKSLDLYLANLYALKREEDKTFPIFNRRFYNTYHDMPLDSRPIETASMIYYVMGLHSKLALLLLERKSSSLSILFEDALEVEEKICASRRIPEPFDFENHHLPKPDKHQYDSDFEQEYYDSEAYLEQQQACELLLDLELDSSVFANYSQDRYEFGFYDQFAN